MRLIDADKLKKLRGKSSEPYVKGWNDAIKAIMQNAPTVEAVEVVKCRDCAYWESCMKRIEGRGSSQGECFMFNMKTVPGFFCKWGEKKGKSK